MAKTEITDLRKIDLFAINPTGFVDDSKLADSLNQLSHIQIIVRELLHIYDKYENRLPLNLKNSIITFNNSVLNFIQAIEKKETGSPDVIARKKENTLNEINAYYLQCLNIDNPTSTNLLYVLSITKSFEEKDENDKTEINNIKQEVKDEISKSALLYEKLSNDENLKKIEQNRTDSETILNELKKKASEQTVSDYAIVFRDESSNYKNLAEKWLAAGIIISIIFLILIVVSAITEFLPTEILIDNKVAGYNITNIITKALIIAVIIFIMSFSFKQYSINRHLQAVNIHRQKALNSYKLFTTSIAGNDINSQNALMIQVAKAIYEPQSTGFLNEKGNNVNSGIIELTKIIGQNNQ